MSGLILKLRPFEQLMINGVLVENGDRKTRLRVCTDGANVLRMRDAMRPEDATTPLKRAYYAAQLAVSGDLTHAQSEMLISTALCDAGPDADAFTRAAVERHIADGDFYKVMRVIGNLTRKAAADLADAENRAGAPARAAAG